MPVFKPLERLFKSILLEIVSLFAGKPEIPVFSPDRHNKQNILIIRPEKIGDIFVSLPLVDALKHNFPEMSFYIIGSNDNRVILDGDPRFDNVYIYSKRFPNVLSELKIIRSRKFDCVIDLVCDDSVTSLLLTLISGGNGYRIGMGKQKYAKHYHENYQYRTDNDAHIIDNTLKILKTFGVDPESANRYSPPYLSEASKNIGEKFIVDLHPAGSDAEIFGINISAGADNRKWTEDKYKALINELLEINDNTEIVIICTPADRDLGKRLSGQFGKRVNLIPPKLSIRDASAVISKLSLLVSPDTSLIHIARSFRVPIVGLYCSFMENHRLWYPYGQKNGVVLSESESDIRDITVESVIGEIKTVLAKADGVSSQTGRISI